MNTANQKNAPQGAALKGAQENAIGPSKFTGLAQQRQPQRAGGGSPL